MSVSLLPRERMPLNYQLSAAAEAAAIALIVNMELA